MNPVMSKKWGKALKSKKYKQGKGHLRKDNAYCCLGVLCDINGVKWNKSNDSDIYYAEGNNLSDILDYDMRDKFGLSFDQMNMLMRLNDTGKDFDYIANVIEKQL